MADRAFFDRWLVPTMDLLARYHRFEARGIENVPAQGRTLIVATHSALTYDYLLGIAAIYRRTGRMVRSLGDRFWFRVPVLGELMGKAGVVIADPASARSLLVDGELVATGPGGMWEALRPSSERFQLRWQGRLGFARLALETDTPIVLASCPAVDLALTMYASTVTDRIYQRFKLPLPFMRGIGPTLVPRPVKLTAYFSEPIAPRGPATESAAAQLAELCTERMRRLIDDAVREEGL